MFDNRDTGEYTNIYMLTYEPATTLDHVKLDILAEIPAMTIYASDGTALQVDGDYDGEWLGMFKWHVNPNGYVMRTALVSEKGNSEVRRPIYLHNMVLPAKEGYRVVHVDGDKLNNRSCNLMYLSISDWAKQRDNRQIVRQKSRTGGSNSGYRGVFFYQHSYRAACKGKVIGQYRSAINAARAYDIEAYSIWGDKAILNFPHKK